VQNRSLSDSSDETRMDHRSRLPADLTSFVGRREEIAEVKRLLSSARLVTISGVGGVGKTRLALRVLKSVEAASNGAFLVELASLRDPALLAHTALSALGIPETSARSPESLLIEFFRERDALLVLDNCEHLLDACARLAAKPCS
jgi:predicted ATPase